MLGGCDAERAERPRTHLRLVEEETAFNEKAVDVDIRAAPATAAAAAVLVKRVIPLFCVSPASLQ